MRNPINKIEYTVGQKLGNCIYIGDEYSEKYRRYAKFKCNCGNYFFANIQKVKIGHTKSCGCLVKKILTEMKGTHLMAKSNEYKIWIGIIQRCTNPNNKLYEYYGGRGISVCDRWMKSFISFFEDMGKRPSGRYELDRYPNNNGNYEPSNCRWATKKQNCRNRRNNLMITYKGETKTLIDWSDQLGLNYQKTYQRIKTYGWTIERALEKPLEIKYARSV